MTPDGFIRWYYEESEKGAPGLDPVDSMGRVYAERCPECPSRRKHPTRTGGYACGSCGADWPYEDRFILKGVVSTQVRVRGNRVTNIPSPSAGGSERRISRRVDVGVLLASLLSDPQWKRAARYYVSNALGYSVRQLAEECHFHWPGFPAVSRSSVGRMIVMARAEWTRRLENAGMLK